jgi:hypothetical protein
METRESRRRSYALRRGKLNSFFEKPVSPRGDSRGETLATLAPIARMVGSVTDPRSPLQTPLRTTMAKSTRSTPSRQSSPDRPSRARPSRARQHPAVRVPARAPDSAPGRGASGQPASMSESVRSLLTTAERKLLESSVGSSMEKATEKMLKTAVRRARELRDKWLDKFARQNRTTKRGRGGAVKGHLGTVATPSTSNVRSREKAELFDGALRRFEERLRILLEPVRPAETGAAKRSRAKASKPRAGSGIVRGVGGAKTKRPSRPDAAAATGQVAARANASKTGDSWPWKKSSQTFSRHENLRFSRVLRTRHVIHDVRQAVSSQLLASREKSPPRLFPSMKTSGFRGCYAPGTSSMTCGRLFLHSLLAQFDSGGATARETRGRPLRPGCGRLPWPRSGRPALTPRQ